MPRRKNPKQDSALESLQPWQLKQQKEEEEQRKQKEQQERQDKKEAAQVRKALEAACSTSEAPSPHQAAAHCKDGDLERKLAAPTDSVQEASGAGVDRESTQNSDETSKSSRPQASRGSRGPGAGAGVGVVQGGGEESGDSRIHALGKRMTSILRHRAPDFHLHVRSDGYVDVAELLKLRVKTPAGVPLSSHTVEEVREAVTSSSKQRFSLLEENGKLLVRANQGHSIPAVKTEDLLTPLLSAQDVPVCVHGTYREHLAQIKEEGLKTMGRLHIHFATGLPKEDGVISGMRQSSQVLIHLDVEKALKDGMKLFTSDNGVILTEGFNGVVPPAYFRKVEFYSPKRRNI